MQHVRFPKDSNIRYLPLMYFLPEDLIAKCPALRSLPRCLGQLSQSDEMIDLIASDQFLNEIMDATAAMAFPHFGFGGWKENYMGYCPVWMLSYSLPVWAKLLKKEISWGLQTLFKIPASQSIPFFEPDYIAEVMEQVVKRAISEEEWQPILDVVREMPCDEDFEKRNTNVRIDFLRKWYHTRSERVKTVSLEACMEDEDHHIHEIATYSVDIAENVAGEDFCQRFKAQLTEKDMEILELRVKGFTYEEIAKKLGYKTHSGVVKRMQAITKKYLQYEEQQ